MNCLFDENKCANIGRHWCNGVFGGVGNGCLTASFIGLGVIHESRLMVNPVALGSGVPCSRMVKENQP